MLLAATYGRGVSQPPSVVPEGGLAEVADRVWVSRHEHLDVTTTVVAGESGLVVVDAPSPEAAGRELLEAVRRLGRDPVALVRTHAHAGQVLGSLAGVPTHAHEAAAAAASPAPGPGPGLGPELRTLSSVAALDLGGRVLEVVHPGRGHTAGDVVVRVPDAEVVVVGDLVAAGPPAYGPDCWPLEWPATLDLVIQLLGGPGSPALVVPRHGAPVGRDHVEQQRDEIATVAETVRELAGRGVPVDRALAQGAAEGSWPWPEEHLAHAVRRGYAHLPRSAKQLPLA